MSQRLILPTFSYFIHHPTSPNQSTIILTLKNKRNQQTPNIKDQYHTLQQYRHVELNDFQQLAEVVTKNSLYSENEKQEQKFMTPKKQGSFHEIKQYSFHKSVISDYIVVCSAEDEENFEREEMVAKEKLESLFEKKVLSQSLLKTNKKQHLLDSIAKEENLLEGLSAIKVQLMSPPISSSENSQKIHDLTEKMEKMIMRVNHKSQIDQLANKIHNITIQLEKLKKQQYSKNKVWEEVRQKIKLMKEQEKESIQGIERSLGKKQRKIWKQYRKRYAEIQQLSELREKYQDQKHLLQYGKKRQKKEQQSGQKEHREEARYNEQDEDLLGNLQEQPKQQNPQNKQSVQDEQDNPENQGIEKKKEDDGDNC